MLSSYKGKDYKKTIFINDLANVAKLLADLTPETENHSSKNADRQFAAALRLIHDVVIAKEIKRRHSTLSLSQG